VFAGSTNEENYLQDPTGARRFWPISVINVDVEALTRDRDQIWAEAVYAMRAGRPCYLDAQQHVEQAKIEQERRYSADEWENVVSEYLSDNGLHSVTVPTLLLHALKIDAAKWTRSDQMRVATAMKRLGWERRKATAPNGQRFWEYVPGPKALVVPAEPLPANVLAFRNSMRGRTVPGPVASGPGMGPTPAGSNASVLPLRKPDRPDTA
jgi:putative DNA primase/helicase